MTGLDQKSLKEHYDSTFKLEAVRSTTRFEDYDYELQRGVDRGASSVRR